MADLREKVEEDRGLLKKIELAIPGFRGYRKREDLRIADSLLRSQIADKLKDVSTQVELCRQELAKKMELDLLEDAGRLVNSIQKTENRVRHAEQGYTGISADFRIEVRELNKLYEWDLALIEDISKIKTEVNALQNAILSGIKQDMSAHLHNARTTIQEFNTIFDKRIDVIGCGGV